MEQCTKCEPTFRSYAPLTLTVQKSGSNVLVYAQNNGRNIIILKRILLCLEYSGGGYSILYIRNFQGGGDTVEQGLTQLKYTVDSPTSVAAQVEAEYWEVTGRERSCRATF